jgi:chromate transporter
VQGFGWLSPGEMLDGLGLAETTPGPLILVLVFVGYLAAFREAAEFAPHVAGLMGALVVAWVTFVPSFLWIFAGAPYAERMRGRPGLAGALAAITAAVVGVILNLSLWFALHLLFAETRPVLGALELPVLASVQWVSALIAAAAMVAALRFKVGIVPLLMCAAAAGWASQFVV